MGTNQNPRQQLRDAIEANAAALADMHHAENTLARAHEMLGALMVKRADFDSLDTEIATARAALVKQAIESEENAHLLTEEPSGFAAQKIARDNLDLQLQGIRDSIPVLQEQLAKTQRNAEDCDNAIELAREQIFCAEAEELARDFTEKLAELRRMSHKLRFMAARQVRLRRKENGQHNGAQMTYWGLETTRAISMKPFVIGACHEQIMGDSDLRGGIRVRDKISKAVQDYWSALRLNADAQFEADQPEPIIVPEVEFTEDEMRL